MLSNVAFRRLPSQDPSCFTWQACSTISTPRSASLGVQALVPSPNVRFESRKRLAVSFESLGSSTSVLRQGPPFLTDRAGRSNQGCRRRKESLRPGKRRMVIKAVGTELGGALEVINNLGLDTLTFLVATVLVIPAFKSVKASPILGFLLSGVVLSQLGLIRNVTDVKALSELGILFLLFEMGLELSLERLKALAKFAFGIGLPQVLLCTLAFTAFELPTNNAIGTRVLEFLFNARPDLVNIRSVDEAIVIGAALSLSSSAFVLQLLAEKGELPTRFGSATLGILLLQDIAVVPLLVVLPILETGNFTDDSLLPLLVAAGLKALLGLGGLLLAGRLLLRRFFEVVADSRSAEAFVALCLLTVTGTSYLTQRLGFSDSLGAFLAGALLAETNYRTQVEADIRPFRGLLLGLFFTTTGTSIDFNLLIKEWPNVLALLGGLIAIKTTIISGLSLRSGLTLTESLRTGLLLSQGGEFAFVVFSLANQLGVLPLELNRLLIIVVVLSMALTPALDSVGRRGAEFLENLSGDSQQDSAIHISEDVHFEAHEPVVIVGFGQMGQVLANFLSTPLIGGDSGGWPYVSFDLDPRRVKLARSLGFRVLYGDGSRPAVLETAGITRPKAMMVMYSGRGKSTQAVERLRDAWPGVPIYARAQDLKHMLELRTAGATDVVLENAETSLRLGSVLLQRLGVMRDDVAFLRRAMRDAMDQRAREALINRDGDDSMPVVGSFQDDVRNTLKSRGHSSNGALQSGKLGASVQLLASAAGAGGGGSGGDSRDDPLQATIQADDYFPYALPTTSDSGGYERPPDLSHDGAPANLVKGSSAEEQGSLSKSSPGIATSATVAAAAMAPSGRTDPRVAPPEDSPTSSGASDRTQPNGRQTHVEPLSGIMDRDKRGVYYCSLEMDSLEDSDDEREDNDKLEEHVKYGDPRDAMKYPSSRIKPL